MNSLTNYFVYQTFKCLHIYSHSRNTWSTDQCVRGKFRSFRLHFSQIYSRSSLSSLFLHFYMYKCQKQGLYVPWLWRWEVSVNLQLSSCGFQGLNFNLRAWQWGPLLIRLSPGPLGLGMVLRGILYLFLSNLPCLSCSIISSYLLTTSFSLPKEFTDTQSYSLLGILYSLASLFFGYSCL